MAERPHLRRDFALIGERIVSRNTAVIIQAHHLAQVCIHVLRWIKLLTLTGADPQHAVTIKRNTMTEMAVATYFRSLSPNHFEIFQCAVTSVIQRQAGACYCC